MPGNFGNKACTSQSRFKEGISVTLPRVFLVGGGHAQLAVLADWIRHGRPRSEAWLVNPGRFLRYSGMIPGIISGDYRADDGLIDLPALASVAGVGFIEQALVSLDVAERHIVLDDGRALPFDYCSIDVGGVGQAVAILGSDPRLLDIRPIDRFLPRLLARITQSPSAKTHFAVIGGGAGGVEIAFALRNATDLAPTVEVQLITGKQGLLPDQGAMARKIAAQELRRQNIVIDCRDARVVGGKLYADAELVEPIDHIIAAIGSAAPAWPTQSGLAVDNNGFIIVDRYQRSVSHPFILATGDVAARQDRAVPHSGVHAVHAGPILAANLRTMLAGNEPSESYTPRRSSLYLLSTGRRSAILVYGRFSALNSWTWWLKRWIDKRWVSAYCQLTERM